MCNIDVTLHNPNYLQSLHYRLQLVLLIVMVHFLTSDTIFPIFALTCSFGAFFCIYFLSVNIWYSLKKQKCLEYNKLKKFAFVSHFDPGRSLESICIKLTKAIQKTNQKGTKTINNTTARFNSTRGIKVNLLNTKNLDFFFKPVSNKIKLTLI